MSYWDTSNLPIPLLEFMKLFNLTEKEVRREGTAARFVAIYKEDDPGGFRFASKIAIRESEARRWVLHRNLPPRIRAKVKLAGGLDALQRWRNDYFDKLQFNFHTGTFTLPDGTEISNVTFSEASKH